MAINGQSIRGFILRGLMALSLVLAAFAHQPAAFAKPASADAPDLLQYVLPDGSLPVICFGGSGNGDPSGGNLCPFCVLAGSVLVPAPSSTAERNVHVLLLSGRIGLRAHGFDVQTRYPAAPPTGPPFSRA